MAPALAPIMKAIIRDPVKITPNIAKRRPNITRIRPPTLPIRKLIKEPIDCN